jgi:hypothetical protein
LTADLESYSLAARKWNPVAGQTVGFFELVQNACLNKPSQWNPVGSATTANDGHALLKLKPGIGVHLYAAAYKNAQSEVLTSSYPLNYNNTAMLRPRIEYAVPSRDLLFPDLHLPRPPELNRPERPMLAPAVPR